MKDFKISAGLEKMIDVLGEILAFLTIGLYAFMIVQYTFGFLDGVMVGDVLLAGLLEYIKYWATLLVLAMKGFEFAVKRGFIVFIIYAALVAISVIFMFFPGVWTSIVTM